MSTSTRTSTSVGAARLRWVREDPTACLGVLVTSSGRVLADGVTLDQACELFAGEVIVTRV